MASRLNWGIRGGGGARGEEEKRQGREKEKNQEDKENVVKRAGFYMKEKLGEGK